jgi:CRISPR-associated endoribonuclease Cas6
LNCYLGSKEVDFGLEEYEFEHGKRVIVKHMNQKHPDSKPLKFPGFQGKIKLNAPSSVLRLLYQAGIGARRSQGFGMVDIKS